MKFFHIIQTMNLLTSIVVIFYFIIGIADGTVTGRNITLWLMLLLGIGTLLGGSMLLYHHKQYVIAWIIACLLFLPTLIAIVYLIMIMLGALRWN